MILTSKTLNRLNQLLQAVVTQNYLFKEKILLQREYCSHIWEAELFQKRKKNKQKKEKNKASSK